MKLKDAIVAGKNRFQNGRGRKTARSLKKILTPQGVISFFKSTLEREGFGYPQLITEKEHMMLKGVIKLIKKNNHDDEYIYSLIKYIISNWGELKRMEFTTMKGKPWIVGDRPTLKDILICRESMLANIDILKNKEQEISFVSSMYREKEVAEHKTVISKCSRFKIDQEEVDAEYLEDYNYE